MRMVIGSDSRLTRRKSCLTFTPRGTIPKSWLFSGKRASVQASATAGAAPNPRSSQHPSIVFIKGRAITILLKSPAPEPASSPPVSRHSLPIVRRKRVRLVFPVSSSTGSSQNPLQRRRYSRSAVSRMWGPGRPHTGSLIDDGHRAIAYCVFPLVASSQATYPEVFGVWMSTL